MNLFLNAPKSDSFELTVADWPVLNGKILTESVCFDDSIMLAVNDGNCQYCILGSTFHWDSLEQRKNDIESLSIDYEDLLDQIINSGSKNFDMYSKKFLRIVLGPWIAYSLHSSFSILRQLDFIRKQNGTELNIISFLRPDLQSDSSFSDFNSWMTYLTSDQYVIDLIFQKFAEDPSLNFIFLDSEHPFQEKIYSKKTSTKNKLVKRFFDLLYPVAYLVGMRKRWVACDYYMSIPSLILISMYAKSWVDFQSTSTALTELSIGQTVDIFSILGLEGHLSVRDDSVVSRHVDNRLLRFETLPLEAGLFLEKMLLRPQEASFPAPVFTSIGLLDIAGSIYTVAQCALNGGRVIYGQHGGLYGSCYYSWAERHEIECSDIYLTWGWKPHLIKSENIISFGAFTKFFSRCRRLRMRAMRSLFNQDWLLLVGTSAPSKVFRLDSSIRKVNRKYISRLVDFARTCDQKCSLDLKVRLHPSDNGWGWRKYFEGEMAKMLVGSDLNISYQLARSRLVIYTCNSTGYFEYIAMNIPTIVIFDTRAEPLRADAVELFKKMEAVGLFFESFIDAHKFIMAKNGDFSEWWDSPEVRAVIQILRSNYFTDVCRPEKTIGSLLREK